MTGTWSIYMVWADGNPIEVEDGLDMNEAINSLRSLRERHPNTPPAIFAVDAQNPERNWDAYMLEDVLAVARKKIATQPWIEYAAGIDAEANGPDMTPADMR